MTNQPLSAELAELLSAVCEESASDQQLRRLEALAKADGNVYRIYLNYLALHGSLGNRFQDNRHQATSAAKLIAEWQSRDNEFWNDVVKAATGLEPCDAQSPVSRSQSNAESDGTRARRHPSSGRSSSSRTLWIKKLEHFTGILSRTAWLTLVWLTGAMFVLAVGITLWSGGRGEAPPFAKSDGVSPTVVARLTDLQDVQWTNTGDANRAPTVHSTVTAGQRLELAVGLAEITFENGARVVVEGPTHFVVGSASHGELKHGRLIARVPGKAVGFSINTPSVTVTDLGTEFALEVDRGGESEVHVFDGRVVVDFDADGNGQRSHRVELAQSEAARFVSHPAGVSKQIASPERFQRLFHLRSAPVLAAANVNSGPPYTVVPSGLRAGAPAYTDRKHRWVGIDGGDLPAMLRGADYVLTRNEDKRTEDLQIRLTVTQAAHLFVLFDTRLPSPTWLSRDFVDTGEKIGLHPVASDETVVPYAIWRRTVSPGNFDLGMSSNRSGPASMYGIAAVATPESESKGR